MNTERMNDMIECYGEVCDQKVAAKILNVTPQTIYRMVHLGRLRGVLGRIDVRSIVQYIEDPIGVNFLVSNECKRAMTRDELLKAARQGHWNRLTKL